MPLDKLAGDPVDIFVNGRLIARGEVLVLNDNFCVRVAELITRPTPPSVMSRAAQGWPSCMELVTKGKDAHHQMHHSLDVLVARLASPAGCSRSAGPSRDSAAAATHANPYPPPAEGVQRATYQAAPLLRCP